MDKIATNNFIVVLRKDVKNAKAMVAGNLVRKIKEIRKASEKEGVKDEDASKKNQVVEKINKVHSDIKQLKELDTYQICKKAIIKHDADHWKRMISDSKASKEDILTARVISKGKVQKEVAKFRSDHPDCDEWLEEYFEFREKKRQLTEAEINKRKQKKFNKDNTKSGDNNRGEKRSRKPPTNGKRGGQERRNAQKQGRANPGDNKNNISK